MPPTLLWPLSCIRPAASAPCRKASLSDSSRSTNGTFMRERTDACTGLR
ncbi:Uncharacterised protein [Bordetella pertussis]|nr:Uncharacterised protein [Bordetella pertussis]